MNFFRILAIVILCGILTKSIHAQSFGGGIILGLSASQVGGDNLAGFHKAGLLTGAFVNRTISLLLSVQMEMTYIQKGSNNPYMNDYEHKKVGRPDISMSYIEVPLLLQYQQSEILKIEGGVQLAYLIDGYYNDYLGKIDYQNSSPFIKYDIGLLLGLDYAYSKNISLNTRINNSILPIGAEDYVHPSSFNSSRKGKYNSVLSFAIHYNF